MYYFLCVGLNLRVLRDKTIVDKLITSTMMINKITTFVHENYFLIILATASLKQPSRFIEVPKVFKPKNERLCFFKNLS